jgi:hypothetical protein
MNQFALLPHISSMLMICTDGFRARDTNISIRASFSGQWSDTLSRGEYLRRHSGQAHLAQY